MFFKLEKKELKILQELTKELKEKEKQLKKYSSNQAPSYNKYDYSRSPYSLKENKVIHLSGIIASFLLYPGIIKPEEISIEIEKFLPTEGKKYLKELGNFFYNLEENIGNIKRTKEEILKIEKEIEICKNKLHI